MNLTLAAVVLLGVWMSEQKSVDNTRTTRKKNTEDSGNQMNVYVGGCGPVSVKKGRERPGGEAGRCFFFSAAWSNF